MIEHKLSDKYSIWVGRYTKQYDQKDFLNAVKLNESLSAVGHLLYQKKL